MATFGMAAVRARDLIVNASYPPLRAWNIAVAGFTDSRASQAKNGPRIAFLALCEAGLIKGIPPGSYARPHRNEKKPYRSAKYALAAWREIEEDPRISVYVGHLWQRLQRIAGAPERHGSQLDVVLGLWRDQNGIE